MWSSRSQPPRQAREARATPVRAPGVAARTRRRGPAGPEGWPKTAPTALRRRRKVVAPRPPRQDDTQRLQCLSARSVRVAEVALCGRMQERCAGGPTPSWAAVVAARRKSVSSYRSPRSKPKVITAVHLTLQSVAARRWLWRQSQSGQIGRMCISTRSGGLHRRSLPESDHRRPVLRRGTPEIALRGAPGPAQSDGASSAAAHAAESARRRVRRVSPRRRRRSQPPSWR